MLSSGSGPQRGLLWAAFLSYLDPGLGPDAIGCLDGGLVSNAGKTKPQTGPASLISFPQLRTTQPEAAREDSSWQASPLPYQVGPVRDTAWDRLFQQAAARGASSHPRGCQTSFSSEAGMEQKEGVREARQPHSPGFPQCPPRIVCSCLIPAVQLRPDPISWA